MPVQMYRNNQPGPTVLSSDPKGTESVEWQGAGDPNGDDVQPVSELIQSLPVFQKHVRRGLFTLVDETSQEYIDSQDKQQAHWEKRMSQPGQEAAAVIDQQANNDIVGIPCVGPSSRPGEARCGTEVAVRDKDRDQKPPLCTLHADLASQYVPSQDVEGGKSTTNWIRVTLGARERFQQ